MDTLAIWTGIILWCLYGGLVAEQAHAKGWRWYAFMLAGMLTLVIDTSYRRGRWHCRDRVEQHGLKPAWQAMRELPSWQAATSASYQRGVKDELLTQLSEQRRGPAKAARQWWKGAKWMSKVAHSGCNEQDSIRQLVKDRIWINPHCTNYFDQGGTDALTILRKAYRL